MPFLIYVFLIVIRRERENTASLHTYSTESFWNQSFPNQRNRNQSFLNRSRFERLLIVAASQIHHRYISSGWSPTPRQSSPLVLIRPWKWYMKSIIWVYLRRCPNLENMATVAVFDKKNTTGGGEENCRWKPYRRRQRSAVTCTERSSGIRWIWRRKTPPWRLVPEKSTANDKNGGGNHDRRRLVAEEEMAKVWSQRGNEKETGGFPASLVV